MEPEYQIAVVTAKVWCHDFKIGTKVKIRPSKVNRGVYIATDAKGNVDYLKENEWELSN